MDKTSTCTFYPSYYFFELASRKGFYYFVRTASPQSYILFRLIPITLPAVLNTIAYGQFTVLPTDLFLREAQSGVER
ncbi:hypothetical protein BDZ89DRAFT_1070569 [Hymenopellis radicata]|nr:hypothetical protein BDZ89DRAFT_1070569 [Hymenopellis radicata]